MRHTGGISVHYRAPNKRIIKPVVLANHGLSRRVTRRLYFLVEQLLTGSDREKDGRVVWWKRSASFDLQSLPFSAPISIKPCH